MANRKNTFLIKRSNVAGKIPSAGDLLLGELALNTADNILYASGTTANAIIPIGWDRVAKTGDTMSGPLYTTSLSAISANPFTNTGDLNFVASSPIPGINLRTPSQGSLSIMTNYFANDSTTFLTGIGAAIPSGAARLHIDHTNGNVGVGTSSPAEKLDVNGTVKANKVQVTNTIGIAISNLGIDASGFIVSATTSPMSSFCTSGLTTTSISGCSTSIDILSNISLASDKKIIGALNAGTGISLGGSGIPNGGVWNMTDGGDYDATLTLDGDSSITTLVSTDSGQSNNAIIGLNASTGIAALAVNMGNVDSTNVSMDASGGNPKVTISAYQDSGGDTGSIEVGFSGITLTNGYFVNANVSPQASLNINNLNTILKGFQIVNLQSQSTDITIDGSNDEINVTSGVISNIVSSQFNINGGNGGYTLPLTGGTIGQVLTIIATGSTATVDWVTNSSFLKGTTNIDFGDESDSAYVTISSSAVTNSNINTFSTIFIETTETSLDDFTLNGLSFNIENIIDGVSFDIRGRAINNASGIYTIKYMISY